MQIKLKMKQQKIVTASLLLIASMSSSVIAQEINYNGTNNINNNKTIVQKDADRSGKNIMTPNEAIDKTNTPMNTPVTPPTGLPNDVTKGVVMNNSNYQISGKEAEAALNTINILNTDNSKIRKLNKDIFEKGKIIAEMPVIAPKTVNDILIVKLGPGSVSPVIRTFKNRTTTIMLTDSAGQPWPIINYDGLPKEDFTINRLDAPAPNGSIMSITPIGGFVNGNLQLVLKGNIPVNIEVLSAQEKLDGITQLRVQGTGPNSITSSVGLPGSLNTELMSVLNGIAPKNSKELTLSTKAAQAWQDKNNQVFIRTRYKLMSPAFREVTSSGDGTFAYIIEPVDTVLYKTEDGRFGEFNIELIK